MSRKISILFLAIMQQTIFNIGENNFYFCKKGSFFYNFGLTPFLVTVCHAAGMQ